jgi:hypothetical protein
VHEAYKVWLSIWIPVTGLVIFAWDKPWWHTTAQHIMRVG